MDYDRLLPTAHFPHGLALLVHAQPWEPQESACSPALTGLPLCFSCGESDRLWICQGHLFGTQVSGQVQLDGQGSYRKILFAHRFKADSTNSNINHKAYIVSV